MIGNIPRFGLTVVIVIHVLYFLKSNSRPNRGIFVIMFMLGRLHQIKVGLVLGPGL